MVNVSWKAVIIVAWVTVMLLIVMAIVLAFQVKTKEDKVENPNDEDDRAMERSSTTFDEYIEAQQRLEDSVSREPISDTYREMLRYQQNMGEDRPLYPSHILFTADLNSPYLPYWEPLCHAWFKVTNAHPILVLVCDHLPPNIPRRRHVVRFPPIPGIPTDKVVDALQILYPALMLGTTVCTANLNMQILKKEYLEENLRVCGEDQFVSFMPPILPEQQSPVLNVASHQVWAEMFQVRTPLDIQQKIQDWFGGERKEEDEMSIPEILFEHIQRWDTETMLFYVVPGHHFEPLGCQVICQTVPSELSRYSHAYLPEPETCPSQVQRLFQFASR